MSSSEHCSVCNACAVIHEDGQDVCIECGVVQDRQSINLVSTDNGDSFNFVPTKPYTSSSRKRSAEPEGLYAGRQKTMEMCQRLMMTPDIKESATTRFVQLYYEQDYKNCDHHTKMALAGLCAYIEARVNNFPVLISDIQNLLNENIEKQRFIKLVYNIRRSGEVTFPYISIAEVITTMFQKSAFPRTLYQPTIALVKVFSDIYRDRSYSPSTVISPCAYLTWLGSDTCPNTHFNFKKFCSHFNFKPASKSSALEKSLKSKLCQLASCIPWVSQDNVTSKTIHLHLKDIISYNKTLIKKAFTEEERSELKKRKFDEISDEDNDLVDAKILREHPHLDDPVLHEHEFQDEIQNFIKTEEEINQHKSFVQNIGDKQTLK